MVCIYCSGPTLVLNSRLQKLPNQVWRRRHCQVCGATFTTHEAPDLAGSFMLRAPDGSLHQFLRDKLFLSIYESCKHRTKAIGDSSAITLTIIGRLSSFSATGEILRKELIGIVLEVLTQFDATAANVYSGLHSP